LRLLELFFFDEDEPEELDRFLELADRLREEADLDDLDDFFVAGIVDFPSLSKWQPVLRCSLLTCLLCETRAEQARLAELAKWRKGRIPPDPT
jgi:hypothetical protein